MSKAVLVLDMPESCEECPLQIEVENEKGIVLGANICRGLGKYNKDSSKKPNWCPLRPVPEKKETICYENDSWCTVEEKTKNAGWNACVDAIIEN